MYSHRSSTGPVDLAFTDRYDGVSAVPFDSLNLALVGEDDPERPTPQRRAAARGLRPRGRPGRHGAGARRRPCVSAGGPRAAVRRAGHRPRRPRADGAGRRLRAGPARRPRGRGDRCRPRRAARAWPPAWSTACVERMRRARCRADQRLGRAAHLRPLLRGAGRAAGRGRRGRAGHGIHHLMGHARAGHRRGGDRAAGAARRRRCTTPRAARWSPPTSTPTGATAPAPAGSRA